MTDEPNMERDENMTPAGENGGQYSPRPEPTEHFTDAQYIPREQAPNMPRQYSYTPQEPRSAEEIRRAKKRGVRYSIIAALCFVCILLGAAVGIIGMQQWDNWFGGPAEPVTTPVEEATPAPTAVPVTPAPGNVTVSAGMNPADIYDMACTQVVGITTEITYYNRFGIASSSPVTGSGFIISDDGYILTNHHVIEDAVKGGYEVEVMLYDGETYVAEIVGYESDDSDIAVLKIAAEGLNAVTIGDSNAMRVGEDVYAVGNPLGELAYSMTDGMISALDREITTMDSSTGIQNTTNMFQISAAVNSGNSGGPVYDANGQVIGVVTAKYSSTGVEGLGFAIPINDAMSIARDLIEIGYVRGKPFMGITVQTVSSTAAQYYNMVVGAYVYAVEPGSPAMAAGLQMGDIITAVDGVEIVSTTDLTTTQKSYRAGDSAVLTVYRSGEYVEIPITFGEKIPETVEKAEIPAPGGHAGGFNDNNW